MIEYIRNSEHIQKEILINDNIIYVDEELTDIVLKLNNIGLKTSGCCIGDKTIDDYAWIKIQEKHEYNICQLMKNFIDCEYLIEKELYYTNEVVYVDYILKSPIASYNRRVDILKQWLIALNKFRIFDLKYQYKTIEELY